MGASLHVTGAAVQDLALGEAAFHGSAFPEP